MLAVRRRDRDGSRHRRRAQRGRVQAEIRQRPAGHPSDQHARRRKRSTRSRRRPTAGVEIQIFPNSQLGGSTDMLSQVRSGAIDIFTIGSPIANAGAGRGDHRASRFAFPNFDQVWAAVDGDLGAHVAPRSPPDQPDRASRRCGTTAFARSPPASKPINDAGRPQGHEAARAGEPAVHLDVQGARHRADRDQLRRGLLGAADQAGRRAGEPARADRRREVLRGAEILLAHQPHVGGLLDGGEPPHLGAAAGRPARRPRSACSTKAP